MKKIIAALAGVLICASAFAEAPELKKKLPTEWKYMERIEDDEKVKKNKMKNELYEYMKTTGVIRYVKNDDSESFSSSSVFFREIIGEDEFYWQVAFPEVKYQLQLPAAVIGLFYKENNTLHFLGAVLSDFCVTVVAEGTHDKGFQYRAGTFQIIRTNNRAKGFIVYTNCAGLNDDLSYKAIRKGQVRGYTEAEYYLFDSNLNHSFNLNESKAIRINASDFLWDEKNPLHYSLQNAFDGNPATSYVENTEDDLMKIEFQHIEEYNVTGLAIINGYAASEKLYLNNNRVADFQYNSNGKEDFIQKITLEDRKMGYQIFSDCFPNHPFAIVSGVKKIYNGDKYSDTCIAEINLLCKSNSYLFGDLYGN